MRPRNPKYRLNDADAKKLIEQQDIVLIEGYDFVKAFNETLEIYERETLYPTPKEIRDEMNRALVLANKNDPAAIDDLSDTVRELLTQRAAGRGQKLDMSTLVGLITNGAAMRDGRKRPNGARSTSWVVEPFAPPALNENRQRVPRQRREPEKNLVMNLQLVWLEATGTDPAKSATGTIMREDSKITGQFTRFISDVFERVGARIYADPVNIINNVHRDRLAIKNRLSKIPS